MGGVTRMEPLSGRDWLAAVDVIFVRRSFIIPDRSEL